MPTVEMAIPTREEYERMAYEYMASLPPEHFMELHGYGIQRTITVSSLELLTARRPNVHICSELLIQYPRSDSSTGRVVPDCMIVVQNSPIEADISFNTAYEEAERPFMVIEYVAKGAKNKRKDYEINRTRYEQELKVPYYLLFDPLTKKLTFLHLVDGKYIELKRNENQRYPVPELDLEIAVLDGWVRYWYEGELLPVPKETLVKLEEAEKKIQTEKRRANREERKAEQEKQRAEQEKQRAEQEKQRADLTQQLLEQEKQRSKEEARKAMRLAEKLRQLGIDPDP
jgi:Uma2 family endonuclease